MHLAALTFRAAAGLCSAITQVHLLRCLALITKIIAFSRVSRLSVTPLVTFDNIKGAVLVPMAFESSTLMYTLTAWASNHLSQIEPRFQDIALQHRGTALSCLKTELDKMSISHEM